MIEYLTDPIGRLRPDGDIFLFDARHEQFDSDAGEADLVTSSVMTVQYGKRRSWMVKHLEFAQK